MLARYLRIPRVRRLEYLMDFLQVVMEGYDKSVAERRLADRKRWFEAEKGKALARFRFTEKLKEAADLALDCLTMSLHLGFVQGREKPVLTAKGQALLALNNTEQKRLFAQSFLQTFVYAPHILVSIAKQPSKEVNLPMERNNVLFAEDATRYGLQVGQTSFEVARDLFSQLGLMNWHIYFSNGKRYSKVYLTSNIMSGKGPPLSSGVEAITFTYNGQEFAAVPIELPYLLFKQALWEEYLKLSEYVPRRPIFYSKLRSEVCYRLRVSDHMFDAYATRTMKGDDTYLVVGSGGSLPYSRDSASLLKSLPVKSERGEYIVYLKMDVR